MLHTKVLTAYFFLFSILGLACRNGALGTFASGTVLETQDQRLVSFCLFHFLYFFFFTI